MIYNDPGDMMKGAKEKVLSHGCEPLRDAPDIISFGDLVNEASSGGLHYMNLLLFMPDHHQQT